MNILANNKRAEFDYDLLERFEAGLMLTGHEVKSIRMGHCNITAAHAIIRGGELFIIGMHIPSFQPENAPHGYDPERIKKALLSKKEIRYLIGKMQDGLTIIATKLYNKRRILKLELALARKKKKHDKREIIKKKEAYREIRMNHT